MNFIMGKVTASAKLLAVLFLYANAESQLSLTTATVRENVYVKPTSLHRRINVERSVQKRSTTPLEFFRLRDPKVKWNRSEIWIWDYSCQEQQKTGNCSKSLPKYYYDAQLDKCSNFTYSGCDGNDNNFETLIDCERHCKGAIYMTIKDTKPPTFCSLQPNSGYCMALLTRYYFDVNTGTCKTFLYGGCGGNQNRFNTMRKCLKLCSGKHSASIEYG